MLRCEVDYGKTLLEPVLTHDSRGRRNRVEGVGLRSVFDQKEAERLSVRRPAGVGKRSGEIREPRGLAAQGFDDINILVAAVSFGGKVRDLLAIGRPDRAVAISDFSWLAGRERWNLAVT